VLKAALVATWPRRRISGKEWQAGERAAAILADARAEAEALRRDVEREAARRREEAAREGHAAGLARAAAVLLQAEARRDERLAAAEADAVELGLEVARRLLGRSLALDAGAVRGAAEGALAAVRGRRRATLRLHPAAAQALARESGPLAALAALPAVEVVADPALGPGDAVVETEAGAVDGRLEVRLEAMRRALLEAA
jgi:flagellar biosynthesis/type III secretory pathway protein FliH